jgi:hypothetical protein
MCKGVGTGLSLSINSQVRIWSLLHNELAPPLGVILAALNTRTWREREGGDQVGSIIISNLFPLLNEHAPKHLPSFTPKLPRSSTYTYASFANSGLGDGVNNLGGVIYEHLAKHIDWR